MTERYLFRGKRIDKDEWREGHLIIAGDCRAYITQELLRCKDYGFAHLSGWNEIDSATLGQCTGLKDQNGKLIFEGDILQDAIAHQFVKQKGVVKWGDEDGSWLVNWDNELYLLANLTNKTSVIGNIHDNPELLEKERV